MDGGLNTTTMCFALQHKQTQRHVISQVVECTLQQTQEESLRSVYLHFNDEVERRVCGEKKCKTKIEIPCMEKSFLVFEFFRILMFEKTGNQ